MAQDSACMAQDGACMAQDGADLRAVWDAAQRGDAACVLAACRDATESVMRVCALAVRVAVRNDHAAAVRALVSVCPSLPHHVNAFRLTALHEAARANSARAAAALLGAKAQVHVTDSLGVSPARLAVHRGHADVLRVLLQGKAAINMPPLHARAPALDDLGVDYPPLLQPLVSVAARENHCDVLRVLLDAKAEMPTARENPVRLAAAGGHSQALALLLMHAKASTDAQGEDSTPLHEACRHGHVATVQQLLDGRADVDAATCISGATPLTVAAEFQFDNVARILLRANANVHLAKLNGATALVCAACKGHVRTMRVLLRARAQVDYTEMPCGSTPLCVAAHYGHVSAVQLLTAAGADTERRNTGVWTPLMAAASHNHTGAVRALVHAKADVTACLPLIGWTVLHVAAAFDFGQVARLLLASHTGREAVTSKTATETTWRGVYVPAASTPADVARLHRSTHVARLLEAPYPVSTSREI